MARLLVVEDDPRIASFLKRGLEAEGYAVDSASDGADGLDLAREGSYPLIILDRMLPGMDGVEVCRILRAERNPALILMLTARDGLTDKISGLKSGADDYLTKPFAFDELVARIEALLRRPGVGGYAGQEVLSVGDLMLDPLNKTVSRAGRPVDLTAREFALLEYLMRQPGAVVSRSRLLSNVWGMNFEPGTKILEVYIAYLRRKLGAAGEAPLIHTVRGFGYRIGERGPTG